MLVSWLLFVLTLLLGIGIGWLKFAPGSTEVVKKEIKQRLRKPGEVGAVKRPTAETLEKRKNPLLTETEQAMEETLQGIPELNE